MASGSTQAASHNAGKWVLKERGRLLQVASDEWGLFEEVVPSNGLHTQVLIAQMRTRKATKK